MLYLLAALADLILFLLHVAAIFIGEPAYLFLRAGRVMAEADTNGESWPALLTAFVSTVFLIWTLITYWAGTGRKLSGLARYLVIAIGCVFVLRGCLIFFQLGGYTLASDGEVPQLRDFIFSLSALGIGGLHLAAAIWRR